VARQWIRHRTARLNEISGRYSVLKNEFWLPGPNAVAKQSKDNKQGRETEPFAQKDAEQIIGTLGEGQRTSYTQYTKLLDKEVARELARVNLPLSTYTEWYWQMDLHNLLRFLMLRLDSHAQREIRDYAEVILEITKKVAPLTCASFENHVLRGVKFSGEELEIIKQLWNGGKPELDDRTRRILEEKLSQ
jgi:thymidylate synthase (FAD)